MRGAPRALVIAAVLTAASLSARTGQAYVRSVTDSPPYYQLYWPSSCETATVYLNGFTAMTPDEVAKSVGAAAAAWGPDSVTCPADMGDGGTGHPSFEILPQLAAGGSGPGIHSDGKNSILFETSNWDGPVGAVAYTAVSKEPNGSIFDADIAINADPASGFAWANLDPGASPSGHLLNYDLQTVLTHEFGHFLGLAHTCSTVGTGTDENDGPTDGLDAAGQAIPSCYDTGVSQFTTVMWAYIEDGSSDKRVLSTDDARGVCAIYPPTRTAPACTQNLPDDGCGCATAAGAPMNRLAALALVGLALVARRRRTQRRAAGIEGNGEE